MAAQKPDTIQKYRQIEYFNKGNVKFKVDMFPNINNPHIIFLMAYILAYFVFIYFYSFQLKLSRLLILFIILGRMQIFH